MGSESVLTLLAETGIVIEVVTENPTVIDMKEMHFSVLNTQEVIVVMLDAFNDEVYQETVKNDNLFEFFFCDC